MAKMQLHVQVQHVGWQEYLTYFKSKAWLQHKCLKLFGNMTAPLACTCMVLKHQNWCVFTHTCTIALYYVHVLVWRQLLLCTAYYLFEVGHSIFYLHIIDITGELYTLYAVARECTQHVHVYKGGESNVLLAGAKIHWLLSPPSPPPHSHTFSLSPSHTESRLDGPQLPCIRISRILDWPRLRSRRSRELWKEQRLLNESTKWELGKKHLTVVFEGESNPPSPTLVLIANVCIVCRMS